MLQSAAQFARTALLMNVVTAWTSLFEPFPPSICSWVNFFDLTINSAYNNQLNLTSLFQYYSLKPLFPTLLLSVLELPSQFWQKLSQSSVLTEI